MKIKFSFFIFLLLGIYRLSFGDSASVVKEYSKSISTNLLSFGSYWLDNSMPWYDLYRDPSLPDSFRIIFQDVCDHVEPSSVIGQYYSFNYTDIESSQVMYDNQCQIKFANYDDEFAAKCCSPASPEALSPNYLYAGTTLEFDILVNSNSNFYVWTTGNFNTTGVWDKEHTLRHEVAHGINLRHNDFSELMRSDENNDDNPQRYITDIDRYNYNALYNPVAITKPAKPPVGFLEKLLVHGKGINIEASKPAVVQTEFADIDFYLLNADSTYYYRLDNFIEFNKTVAQKYAYEWIVDTLKVKNKDYNVRAIYSGFPIVTFDSCEANIKRFPHDELKIRFSKLTFESPKKDSTYVSYSTLNFKVFGKSENANVEIKDIDKIASVTYLLEKDDFLKTDIFEPTETNSSTNYQFDFDLSTSTEKITDGVYLVSATVKDSLNAVIAEIIRMPVNLAFKRNCRVDLPLPATESWFDFETRLNFEGSIVAEPSFVDSLDNVLIGFDVYDDYNTETNGFPISIFEWYYPEYFACDSNAYFCYFEKNAKSRPLERKTLGPEEKEKIKNTKSMKFFDASKFFDGSQDSKELTDYFAFSYRYPHSLDLIPGTYTVYMMAIRKDLYEADGTISEIAKSDSSQFIIPFWKMKLRRDYWFANTVVPYKQNLEYEAGKTMEVLFWIPWDMPPYNLMNLDIVRETDNTVVENLTYDMNKKSFVLNWNIPSETVPGFYNLKASNLDYWANINVDQQIDPQVCPLYLSWENSGDWPNNWPGEDSWDWEIQPARAWTPAMGAYTLGAKYSTEGNTGLVSIQKSVSVDSEWDRVLEFAIGVHKLYGTTNFEPLLADYSVATSKDGANWTIEKSAVIDDYLYYNWAVDTMYCFNKYFKPLGNTTNVGIKFIKNGIVTSPPDSQSVLFDEVKVVLSKTPLKTGPTNPSAQYAGGNVGVGWGSATKNSKGLDYYYVYRNGIKIGETTALTFVDSTVSANTFYNYAITAHYDDGSAYPESPMNECSVSIYTGLYSPSNLVITNENPNIRLTWSPVSGASEYKVYSSNDPYGTFTEDTTGTFNGEEWVAPLTESKLFYYVVAVNESMKVKKILKTSGNQVK